MSYKYFSKKEVEGLKDEFVQKLDKARGRAGTPFFLTSSLRVPTQNELAGGVKGSSHLSGDGCDIRAPTSQQKFKIVKALLEVGITRIGVYSGHVHADQSTSLPQNVIWIGTSH